MLRRLFLLVLIVASLPLSAATQGGPIPVPLPLFPPNNWWNIDISQAPVDPGSTGYINFIGAATGLHPDFGGDAGGGDIYGMPFIIVEDDQPKRSVSFVYDDESDGVIHDGDTHTPFPFYPIPDEAITEGGWIEGGPPGNEDVGGDRHILIVDRTNNHLYELYAMYHNGTGWEGGSGAFFDMNTNDRRPEGWTSADAAGLAILPGLVRYDEVFSPGEIRHAFRMTIDFTNGHVYPASHTAGDTEGALPMGARLRLKASKNISGYAPEIQKIFRAMKKYGLIVADNGSDMYISGAYDTRWDNDILNPAFASLTASDFEVIELAWNPPTLVVTMPDPAGAGEAAGVTVTAFEPDYDVATGYTGTIHFTSTDGLATLPSDYTFTAGDAGTHTFPAGITLRTAGPQIVTVTDVFQATLTGSTQVTVGPPAPSSLVAAATSSTQVGLSWSPSAGATQYEIQRASSPGAFTTIDTVPTTNASDLPVASNASFLYRVRALDSASRPSPWSNVDVATTVVFTNDPATPDVTTVQAAHVTQLRQAVNAMRTAAGLGAFSFTDPVVGTSTLIKAIHMGQLRSALSPALTALGLASVTWTDPSLIAGTTVVKAVHVNELRNAVR